MYQINYCTTHPELEFRVQWFIITKYQKYNQEIRNLNVKGQPVYSSWRMMIVVKIMF